MLVAVGEFRWVGIGSGRNEGRVRQEASQRRWQVCLKEGIENKSKYALKVILL